MKKGIAKGKAEGVIDVLEVRGINVPDELRARILACTDLATLKTWIRRAATARSVSELFDASAERTS